MSAGSSLARERDHQELMEAMHEVSTILNTGLDRQSLRILVNLCEAGVNPEALATVVQQLRKEAAQNQQKVKQGAKDQGQAGSRTATSFHN